MTINVKPEIVVSAVAFGIGLFGIGYGLGKRKKLNDISSKLKKSIQQLEDKTEVEIADDIVEAAITEAVDREVSRAAEKSSKKVENDIYHSINSQVRNTVNDAFTNIKDQVSTKVSREVAQLDMNSLRREVVEKAKIAAVEKLDGSMDDILEQFKGNLQNITKVYESLSSVFKQQNQSKGINLTLT